MGMKIWAIGDLHLSFGVPDKSMGVFGPAWENYEERIASFWKKVVSDEDLVLLPGDISWAMRLPEALIDLEWIAKLPGKKVMIRGNHDYWWPSQKKLESALPPSIFALHNNAITFGDVTIGGTRLWDTNEFSYNEAILFRGDPPTTSKEKNDEDEKIFLRELERLKLSLNAMSKEAKHRLVMLHYPPIGPKALPTKTSQLLEEAKIDICVFGHLHSIKKEANLSYELNGIRYQCVSADYINFKLEKLDL